MAAVTVVVAPLNLTVMALRAVLNRTELEPALRHPARMGILDASLFAEVHSPLLLTLVLRFQPPSNCRISVPPVLELIIPAVPFARHLQTA
jgi:hypothetical protein